jgi:proton-translocating NADH-quinone oxidoreductase chain N
LASIKRNSSFSTEAGLKYFIIGSLSSAFFLLGSFFIYLCLGTLNFKNIEILLSFSITDDFVVNFIFLGVFFIVVTFFLKVAVAPFHFWAPDVYEGAPIGSTLVFSLLPKISIFVIFIRWISLFFNFFFTLKFLFLLVGLFSVVFGAYFAFVQKRLKRFIIYSSISQIGFLIIILSVNDFNSINSLFFYLFIYLLTSILLWGNLISYNYFSQAYTQYKNKTHNPIFISDLSFYFKINYIWSITFSFIFFSFAGIPPFSGFLAKVLVLFSIISDYNFLVVFFLVLITLISSYYYLKIIKILFFDSDFKLDKKVFYITKENCSFNFDCLLYSSISFLLIFFFFFPTILTGAIFLITIFLL